MLRQDRTILAASFGRDGASLRHAAEEFREDFQLVAAAVMRCGQALEHAGPNLKADRALVRLAVAGTLSYVSLLKSQQGTPNKVKICQNRTK